jgi:glycosyl transferase family 25
MQAYVINLARSRDRRVHMIAQLKKTHVHYEIIEAVDGRDLDLTDSRICDPSVDSEFRPGVLGCALSHLKVYQRVLDDGLEAALILEDDINLPADLDELSDTIAQHIKGAEAALLNFHSYRAHFTRADWVPLPSSRHLIQVVDKGSPWSTGAYVITREACARMAKFMLPVKCRADNWARFYKEGAIDRVRCVVPMPVENNTGFRTTMDNYAPSSIQARVLETVSNAKIPIVYQALARRRQKRLRHWRSGHAEFVEDFPGAELLPLMRRDS